MNFETMLAHIRAGGRARHPSWPPEAWLAWDTTYGPVVTDINGTRNLNFVTNGMWTSTGWLDVPVAGG